MTLLTQRRIPIRAIIVSVEYTDLLRLTLPYNRHHFSEVCIVTSPADECNVWPVAQENSAYVVTTDKFYRDGARFNKWAALEHGLDCMGRFGWICIMDADVVWPQSANLDPLLQFGRLYTPWRRMMPTIPERIPSEESWGQFKVHPNNEFAGYTQVFHANDPVLSAPPWHQTDWLHAGGADSFFQKLWTNEKKVRPSWQCLHMGPAGTNWCGRVNPIDGVAPAQSQDRLGALHEFMHKRRNGGGANTGFKYERIQP